MRGYSRVIFDLDGTLTDPGEGIINSLLYALDFFGIQGDPRILKRFVGPPLIDSFMKYYGFSEEQAREAVKRYREYFREKGVFENQIYEGIPELLSVLKEQDKKLAIATTKPTVFARQVLEYFRVDHYFEDDLIIGSYLDGRRTVKAELVGAVLDLLSIDDGRLVMVGDRKYDMIGAKTHSIDSIGVTYGYGEEEEITLAEPTYIAHSVDELSALLTGGNFD